nr:hypothetical protein BaRGS_019287 [Batillaria attramentaria]
MESSFCWALSFRADKVVMKLTRWANRLYGEDPYDIPLILKQSTLLFTVVGTTAYGFALVGVAGALRRWKWAGAMVLMAIHRSKFKERAHVYMMDSVYSFYRGPNAYGPSRHFSDWVDFTQVGGHGLLRAV